VCLEESSPTLRVSKMGGVGGLLSAVGGSPLSSAHMPLESWSSHLEEVEDLARWRANRTQGRMEMSCRETPELFDHISDTLVATMCVP